MKHTDAVIIGGGQAGLAMSRSLGERGVDHVVLERGRVGERWRSERWDSLRLLSPNWDSQLPGLRHSAIDPDAFMTVRDFVDYLERYARAFSAPVQDETSVRSVERTNEGDYRVVTNQGTWRASVVVVATGDCDVPSVPDFASSVSPSIRQIVPSHYKSPDALADGGVLVVGASASGVQLADEIHRSGRPVTLAVSRHIRLPRNYRGKDIVWWMDRMGVFDETPEDVFDVRSSRAQPSFQLVGRPDHRTLDLNALQDIGVRLVGRAIGATDGHVRFSDDLASKTARADEKLARMLGRIDSFIRERRLDGEVGAPDRPDPVTTPQAPTDLDLAAAGIDTIVWATGYRRSYPWLRVPVLDRRGEIVQSGGITSSPGLYTLGMRFQRRRASSFIGGVGKDAEEIARHIRELLAAPQSAAA